MTRPRILLAALLSLAAGCDVLGIGSTQCTLIGCTDGITVHLTALPTGPYRGEILGSGPDGLSYTYDIVGVTTPLGTRYTEIANPVYTTSGPNGQDCPPICRQASVTAQLPGS